MSSNVVYTTDDRHRAGLGDRLIAAAIGGLLGFLAGCVLAAFAVTLFGTGAWLSWIGAVGFAVFAFMAPARSRVFWGPILDSALRVTHWFHRR